jgi:enoyl-[acyl-carrier protein] reductase I
MPSPTGAATEKHQQNEEATHATILQDFFGEIYMSTKTGFLSGKKLLITGVLSNRSIAYGIAKACHEQGAELAFSYVGERFKDRITEFAADFDSKLIFDCDVSSDEQITQMFKDLSAHWPTFDGFVHSIGYAPREAIAGDFLDGLSREGFQIAHDISAYSFPAMAKAALPYLNDNSAVLTLSYLGAIRTVPNYNTMGLAKASLEASVRYLAESLGAKGRGLRANGISAGPIKTLAASGIKGFGKILSVVAEASPIRRNVTIEDVGNVAAFLMSDLAAGMTAEISYVDGGFSQVVGGIAEPTDA